MSVALWTNNYPFLGLSDKTVGGLSFVFCCCLSPLVLLIGFFLVIKYIYIYIYRERERERERESVCFVHPNYRSDFFRFISLVLLYTY